MVGRIQAFTTGEFKGRLQKVQAAMNERGLDLLLLHSPENICNITGFQTSGYFAYQVLCVPVRRPANDAFTLSRARKYSRVFLALFGSSSKAMPHSAR